MALRLKDPPAPLRQVLQSQGMFGLGVQDNLRRAMDSTYANLRGGAPSGNIFAAPQEQPAPSAPVASMVDGAPSIFGIGMPRQQEAAIGSLPAPVQIAGGLSRMGGAGQAYAFQTALRDRGINLNPEGQAPGDFMAASKAAEGVFNRSFGGGATPPPNMQAFAPTGLRQRALAAGGAPVEGIGGVQVSGTQMPGGSAQFFLRSDPNRASQPVQPTIAQPTPQPTEATATPLQAATTQYNQALQGAPSVRLQSFESGNEIITVDQTGNVVARAPRTPTPAGYEPAPEGGIKPIKGSPQEQEAKTAEERKKRGAEDAIAKGNLVLSKINEAIPEVSAMTAGPIGAVAGVVPGTPAFDMQATIDTVKANIGFDQLNAMRQASPTGGALGQVAVRELDFLQAALGSLDRKQSPEQLRNNLQQIRTHYNRWLQTYQGINPDEKAIQGGFTPDKLQRLNELRSKMGKTPAKTEQEAEQ